TPVAETVETPETVPPKVGDDPQNAIGGNVDTISCVYHHADLEQLYVTVSFALPTDLNPFNDFYLGCGHGDRSWDDANRIYTVGSPSQWAIAAFSDISHLLSANDVTAFEGVARQLLAN